MRWKAETSTPSEYRVCLCIHVRTGTILLGTWNILMHIFALVLLLFVAFHPDLAARYHRQYIYQSEIPDQHNKSAAAVYKEISYGNYSPDDLFLATLITLGSFLLAALMVYGALKGRASYLMPFFSIQVFDFCITCLSVVGYFSYIPDMKRWIAVQEDVPFKSQLMQMDANVLSLCAILAFVAVLLVKSYLLGMVWSCYKYLQSYERQVARGSRGFVTAASPDPEASEMLLPPKYEDAIMMPVEVTSGPAPPAYSE